MVRIARFLRRKVGNVEIDPWFRLRRARVFVIAHEKLTRPEDVEGLLIEGIVGSRPTTNLQGQGTQRRSRRKDLAVRMGLEHERRAQHEHSHNPEATGPGWDVDCASGLPTQMIEITRCTANNMISATT